MTIADHPPNATAKKSGPDESAPLEPYIIHIRPLVGDSIEQYWIEGRSKMAAMRRAVRLAGVTRDRVISAERFKWSKEDLENELEPISTRTA